MRKSFVVIGMLLCTCLAQAKKQKNVLFILVDDMQKSCIHAYGNSQVVSPNIDQLVQQGISFSHTYTNGALCGALSMPSRAMIMTGRGVFQISKDGAEIPESHITLPELLRCNGYDTFGTGKWHSDKKSFNRSFEKGDNIFFGGMHSYEKNGHMAPRLHHYDSTARYKTPFVGEKFSSEMFADAAVDYLSTRERNAKPFFAFIAFTSPHDPRNQHPDYGYKYNADTLNLPVNYLPKHSFDNGELLIRDEVLLPFPRTESAVRQELAHYYGMISEVDFQIGRIIEALRKQKELDNTIIIFASDNGLAVGRHGLLGKQNLYEHSISVPMLMVVPGMEKGVMKETGCYLYDIYPTVCDLLNISSAKSVTGKSLLPVMKGTNNHREQLFLVYSSIQRALVKDRWKYIIYNVNGLLIEQLFDLNTDSDEMVNLADDEKYRFKKEAYRRILKQEMKKYHDCCDLDKFYWRDNPMKISWDESSKLYIY